ncbi:hypothetical protein [Streptomyces globisporus]|uniref:hypothetical protein n=1 Tax=Streptomyces globisporus TaxID=1908 RepID=UPI00380B564A
MGEHSAPDDGWKANLGRAVLWLVANRRKVYAGLVVALPLLARYIPDFPSDALLDAARVFLGA